ncbi:MAG: DUF1570 domain-containing protein [Planctomycetaceae bacterium]|nr:DUF1570 domain-containing protein [Planctomycetaceae bacterium]
MRRTVTALALLSMAVSGSAFADPLIELATSTEATRGRDVVHTKSICWLETPFGEYRKIRLNEVVHFEKVSDRFEPATDAAVRSQLRDRLGREYAVQSVGDYVVAASPQRVEAYGEHLNEVSRSVKSYFSRRGFRLQDDGKPLVVIVFSSRKEFLQYAEQERETPGETVLGYYHPISNRIVSYDAGSGNEISMAMRQTLAHEAVHQLCFNFGLMSRLAQLPTWLVEGLAINLELPNCRANSGSQKQRVHRDQLLQLSQLLKQQQLDLGSFIANDKIRFRDDTLNAYAISWALTFYLMETQSAQFSAYLEHIGRRSPLSPYPEAERLADFQQFFGNDLSWLEVRLQRYLQELSNDLTSTRMSVVPGS